MTDLLSEFERDCADHNIKPTAALKAGGVHPTLWKKWKEGKRGATLSSFEAAKAGLTILIRRKRNLAAAEAPEKAA